MKCFSACLLLACAAVQPVAASTDVPLLREAALNLSFLKVIGEGCEERGIPRLVVGLLCSYEDQLGGPLLYEEVPKELFCTDSTGKALRIYRVSADPDKTVGVGHGDPVWITVAVQTPDPSAEWVRIRGFLLCAFADDLTELPAVVLPLREEGTLLDVPLEKPRKGRISLSLKKSFEGWTLEVTGKRDYYFNSFHVRDENGLPLKAKGNRTGWSGDVRTWGKDYCVTTRSRSMCVVVTYWNKCMLRKVPVDMKIGLGGTAAPGC